MDERPVWDLGAPIEEQQQQAEKAVPPKLDRYGDPINPRAISHRVGYMSLLWFCVAFILVRFALAEPRLGGRLLAPGMAMLVPHLFFLWVVWRWPWTWTMEWSENELFNYDVFGFGALRPPLAALPRSDGFSLIAGLVGLAVSHGFFLYEVKAFDLELGVNKVLMAVSEGDSHPDPSGYRLLVETEAGVWGLIVTPAFIMLMLWWRVWLGRRDLRQEAVEALTKL